MSTTKVTDSVRNVTAVDAAKLTGNIVDARLPATALNSNVDLTTLSASNLTSGTLAEARLATLDATKLTGTVADARLGTVSASKLSGVVPTANLGTGTASSSTFLRGDGAYAAPAAGFTLATAQSTTSGAAVTFSGIPAGTKVIHVNFVGVSTNTTQELQLRIGDAGGLETSGYSSVSVSIANQLDFDGDTGAFKVGSSNVASDILHGTMILSLADAATFTWCSIGLLQSVYTSEMEISTGSKSLSAELTQIYINSLGTFDAGKINISYQ